MLQPSGSHSNTDERCDYLAQQRECMREFDGRGIDVVIGTDFREYKSILEKHLPGRVVGIPFKHTQPVLAEGNGFWTAGYDQNGRLVLTQAVRLLSDTPVDVSTFFEQNFLDFPPPGAQIDTQKSRYLAGPSAKALKGKIAYHGEVWLINEPEFRGTGLIEHAAKLIFATGAHLYAPDAFVGFIVAGVADKGLPTRQGYMHCEPDALEWWFKDKEKPIRVHMVHQTAADIEFLFSLSR